MREMGLFNPREGNPSPETRATIEQLNEDLKKDRIGRLWSVLITLDMPERLVLEILDARLATDERAAGYWCHVIHEEGGPSPRVLRKYLRDVLDRGLGVRIDHRIRLILAEHDGAGVPKGKLPRTPELFHSGKLPPAVIRRVQREAAEEQGYGA